MLPTMIVLFSTFFHFHYLLKYMSRKSLCHLVFLIIIMSCFYQLKVSYSSYFVWNQAKKKKKVTFSELLKVGQAVVTGHGSFLCRITQYVVFQG